MKNKITILLCSIFLASFSQAQPIKGTYALGGSVRFAYGTGPNNSNVSPTNLSLTLSPTCGYFISDKYLVDFGLTVRYQKQLTELGVGNFNLQRQNAAGINLGITRFFNVSDRFYFTLGATLSSSMATEYYHTKNDLAESKGESESLLSGATISPGFSYFINKRWMLNANVGLLQYSMNYDLDSKLTRHNIGLNLSTQAIGFGVRYLFVQKKKEK